MTLAIRVLETLKSICSISLAASNSGDNVHYCLFSLVKGERGSSARNYPSSSSVHSAQFPLPTHRNLIPITAKVAPSFPATVGGGMMTRCLRDRRVLRRRAVDGVDRHICRSKYILLFLRFHFDFPLTICINVKADA